MVCDCSEARRLWGIWCSNRNNKKLAICISMYMVLSLLLVAIPAPRMSVRQYIQGAPLVLFLVIVSFLYSWYVYTDTHLYTMLLVQKNGDATTAKKWFLGALVLVTIWGLVMMFAAALSKQNGNHIICAVGIAFLSITFPMLMVAWMGIIFYSYSFCTYRRRLAIVLVTLALVITSTSLWIGYSPPKIYTTEIPIQNLPAELVCHVGFDKYRICMLADMHLNSAHSISEVEDIVTQTNDQDCDVVILNGDIGEGRLEYRQKQVETFLKLNVPTYFVLGNHDYWNYDAPGGRYLEVQRYLDFYESNLNITTLVNKHVRIERNTESIIIAGLDDAQEGNSNLTQALDGMQENDVVVLADHNPTNARNNLKHKNVQLQISGHTHGGQVFPFHVLAYTAAKSFIAGLSKIDEKYVYVSEGTFGSNIMRARLGSSREISVIVLRTGDQEAVGGGVRFCIYTTYFAFFCIGLTCVWFAVRGIQKFVIFLGVANNFPGWFFYFMFEHEKQAGSNYSAQVQDEPGPRAEELSDSAEREKE